MSSSEPRDEAHFARLAVLTAQVEQEFNSASDLPPQDREARLIARLADVQTLLADLHAMRDEVGAQLQGSASGQRADAAYRSLAGLGPNK